MSESKTYTRSGQISALVGGLCCLFIGVDAAWKSYKAGFFTFTIKHITATGNLAALEIGVCLVAGTYLLGTAVRHLEDF
jgi:hypothetical protein